MKILWTYYFSKKSQKVTNPPQKKKQLNLGNDNKIRSKLSATGSTTISTTFDTICLDGEL